ncbi:alcohol dehydrogenase [Halorhabdus sp. CBA1104]|uniref:zinc-dependent alcohol dehydrogenase family protein n=1 Tax=unclassified Halorhabdus TaxID=2621901 RepID=UPI0012B35446|nr:MULTISPECIES: zinc-dependent alcohol dehydrogenase family protein [unclassified Halorhabdus]QGN07516.1 alcohol dehydrogenase [Halorhabdus sp. CBA1104]
MRAAVMEAFQEPLTIKEVDDPEPDPDGVVARVDSVGVCRSDWHAWQGHWDWIDYRPEPPHILGHEPVGTIIETGSQVQEVEVGQQVAIPFNFGCGHCHLCRTGHENICENHTGLGFSDEAPGAFAEKVHIPSADVNAVPLPDAIDPKTAAGIGCRFMTSYHGVAHRADVGGGDDVVIYGLGGVGLSGVQIADALGANVVGVDLDDQKLEKAEELGAVETVNANEVDPVEAVTSITNGGADVSVDALGIKETTQNAVNSLAKNGRHVQLGLTTEAESGEIPLPVDQFVAMEVDFYGSFGLQPSHYPEMLDMIRTGKLDPTELVSETISLDEIPGKLEDMSDFNTIGLPVCNEF